MKVTAVFDIGRTNKKCFLFDQDLKKVYCKYKTISEIQDDDGFPCEDISAIIRWVRKSLVRVLNHKKFKLESVNFSAYGASFVHVDDVGRIVTPLYSYLKPMPEEILTGFYAAYGNQWKIAKETASPPLAMLNSGLQLYWLKLCKPELFRKIKWSIHLPQYLSYYFTGLPVSDFTSIGCHTSLWNYSKNDYHQWVYSEGIDQVLPPIVSTSTSVLIDFEGYRIRFGVGIHDSSSALLPYFKMALSPFLLISTGTWSISMNPYAKAPLSKKNLRNDVLKFMQIDGKPVKASRLFLGHEYKLQTEKLLLHFKKKPGYHHSVRINWKLIEKFSVDNQRKFNFETIHLPHRSFKKTNLGSFINFEEAYHQLMFELVELQILSTEMAIGKTSLRKIYIDGGFIDNDIYLKLLINHFRSYKIYTAQSALGSALGAAIVISNGEVGRKSLSQHYELSRLRH